MNILIVDDKQAIQDSLSSLLLGLGHSVDTASNGLDAFEKAQKGDYQLFIVDHLMPLVNGVQLTKNLKQTESCQNIPIIFMTTQGVSSVQGLPEYSLFFDVIAKPIEEELFLNALSKVNELVVTRRAANH